MSPSIVECVPNFSEARRPEIIEEIIKEISTVEGAYLLDQHSDVDHNRTVVTLVGSPESVEEAAFAGIVKAAELIDLNEHSGEHPRIGATDVVPFIPISGATMDDCIEIAKRLGQKVADQLKIPVYLYEEAARKPSRRNLAVIRKGEFETLKEVIATDPNRAPDFGPKELGSAGATVIGAREFLIAFNVYLTTDKIDIAKAIARTVRHSSGGLRYVKAMGILVGGQAQVSMNLTNFRKTSIPLVFETIRREAGRYGVSISHSEVVGLIPQDAIIDSAVWYTQMDLFNPDQVLEKKMYAAFRGQPGSDQDPSRTGEDFTDQLAAGTPVPGGGSAAAYSGAMAAALVAMVARMTLGKSKYANVETQIQGILNEVETLRKVLLAAVDADSAAFEGVMDAYRLPKGEPEAVKARSAAIQEATLEAAQVPFETARKSLRVLQLAIQSASLGNPNTITDAGTAAALAQAAIAGAGYNVRINAVSFDDLQKAKQMLAELEKIENRVPQFMTQLHGILKERGKLPLP
jgi:glutamate formiminotransferase/formiminotetrahydrofolate cyclodeaminase